MARGKKVTSTDATVAHGQQAIEDAKTVKRLSKKVQTKGPGSLSRRERGDFDGAIERLGEYREYDSRNRAFVDKNLKAVNESLKAAEGQAGSRQESSGSWTHRKAQEASAATASRKGIMQTMREKSR